MSVNALRALPRVYDELLQRAAAGVVGPAGLSAPDAPETVRALAEPFQASGMPVFERLAEILARFASDGTPDALLDAASTVVLLSQVRLGSSPESLELVTSAAPARSLPPYRKLLEARKALTGHASDRLGILSAYYADGGADPRLAPELAHALGDADIRALARSWLLEIGPAAAPIVERELDVRRASAADARRAEAAARLRLQTSGGLAFCAWCLREGGPAVRAAVLPPLAELGGGDGARLLAEAAEDVSKSVRRAAFDALGRNPDAEDALLRLAQAALDSGDLPGLAMAAEALKKSPAAFAFLSDTLGRLASGVFGGDAGYPLEIALTQSVAAWNTPEALETLERFLPCAQVPSVIAELALRLHTPEMFYLRYGEGWAGDPAPIRNLLLGRLMEDRDFPLDPRWHSLFQSRNDELMAMLTLRSGPEDELAFLQTILERRSLVCPNP